MKKLVTILTLIILSTLLSGITRAAELSQPTPAFAPNQLIVKYKEGHSPEELKIKISQRTSRRQTFLLGPIRLFFEDLRLRLSGQETPEKKLTRLESAAQEVGVISTEKLFKDGQGQTLANFYLLKTDGRMEVPKAVELYKKLPEVESAEPNYMMKMMGI